MVKGVIVFSVMLIVSLFVVAYGQISRDSLITGLASKELPSSHNVLDVDNLRVYENRVVINVPNEGEETSMDDE